MALHITGNAAADRLLSGNPFALLVGMTLDQQFPMERAFEGPWKIHERLGSCEPAAVASADPEEFAEICSRTPAVHRFPGSMAGRIQALAQQILDEHDGDTARLWEEALSGSDLMERLLVLPGFGPQKARVFVALLGKQLGVRPDGWEKVAGDYAESGGYRSVADVVDGDSLERVRAFKKEKKAAARAT